jgi:hypothetical protein
MQFISPRMDFALLDILDDKTIAEKTGLSSEDIQALRIK